MQYYSENWSDATDKFFHSAKNVGDLRWCVAGGTLFDIPYVSIGNGPNKVVINSGIHGLEGYFGSAAQLLFLDKFVRCLSPRALQNYTIVLIHVINGWGMQNRMREVRDSKTGGLVDLNRNFGIDFSHPDKLPQNPLYEISHDLLLSRPDAVHKRDAIARFCNAHTHDGAWDAICHGQYSHPYGLFYGGAAPVLENRMTMHIYDQIMNLGAQSLMSVGLHTGLGRFNQSRGYVSSQLLVSHPSLHKNTQAFYNIFKSTPVVADERAANGPVLLGDLVDCLEQRYGARDIPVLTADLEIGTGQFPKMSPIYKRMDMGDARYDLLHGGRINAQTRRNLTESWYPSSNVWRDAAMARAGTLFSELVAHLNAYTK
ncbi:MAG: DUF2817 domain-containing protein [Muribaculaceae bacterium]|nr:DUF2817 domain-containing protein [Muribaculaceae bacterium]